MNARFQQLLTRRNFLRATVAAGAASVIGSFGYGWLEAHWPEATRTQVPIANLPEPFVGQTIAVLADLHHGRMTSLEFIAHVVDATNALRPDMIALVGDYVYDAQNQDLFAPCFAELRRLQPPAGVFAVPGNHDYWDNIDFYHGAVANSKIQEVTNRGVWLEKSGQRLRVAGVDDLWCGKPNLAAALDDCKPDETTVLLCHNPDFVESITDRRVGLVVSGHTHGGQVLLPMAQPRVPSRFGTKYLKGLVQGPTAQVYVSRGLGVVGVPFRFRARPEIALLTLARA